MSNDPREITKFKRQDGSFIAAQADANGNLLVSLNTLLAGEDATNDVIKVEQRNAYSRISTAIGTLVKTGAGLLHLASLHKTGENWEVDVYDGTDSTGTCIAQIRGCSSMSWTYDVAFSTGLFIDSVKGDSPGDLTVSYR
jgi:hypothetical protein